MRFGGALADYTVAQHSVLVAKAVLDNWGSGAEMNNLLKRALLHDAPEAYIRDMPTPAKRMLPDYDRLEYRLMEAVEKTFHLEPDMENIVSRCDQSACGAEARHFLKEREDLGHLFPPVDLNIDIDILATPWDMDKSKEIFIKTWNDIVSRSN
jgi:hypothetical protein